LDLALHKSNKARICRR